MEKILTFIQINSVMVLSVLGFLCSVGMLVGFMVNRTGAFSVFVASVFVVSTASMVRNIFIEKENR